MVNSGHKFPSAIAAVYWHNKAEIRHETEVWLHQLPDALLGNFEIEIQVVWFVNFVLHLFANG